MRAETVLLAGEAYLTRLRPLHRALLPVWSLIVLTEPLPDALWEEIGWREHELVGSPRYTVVYLSRTADGRVLFGGRGAPYRFGSPIRDEYDRHDPTHEMLRGLVRDWFPQLRDVRFSHAWGGPVGMPRDWHPTISYDARSGIATARGYVGHGVANSNLAGRTLAELITGQVTERTTLPLVGHRSSELGARAVPLAGRPLRADRRWRVSTAKPTPPGSRRAAAPSGSGSRATEPGQAAALTLAATPHATHDSPGNRRPPRSHTIDSGPARPAASMSAE